MTWWCLDHVWFRGIAALASSGVELIRTRLDDRETLKFELVWTRLNGSVDVDVSGGINKTDYRCLLRLQEISSSLVLLHS